MGNSYQKGEVRMMSSSDSSVFPGQQGVLEHVIAAKAVAFGEALDPSFKTYQAQVQRMLQLWPGPLSMQVTIYQEEQKTIQC